MPYARINMAEFTSSAEAERTIAILRNDIKSVFPEIRAFACVETTETSALTISIYDDEEAANRAAVQRDKHHEDKDLADLLQMAHKMRMEEIKAQTDLEKVNAGNIKNQTNVQINESIPFGQGNYGKLMEKLLNGDNK